MCRMSLPHVVPPAGWYADPQSPVVERYWDGQQWSPHTRPRVVPPPATDLGPSSALHYLLPVGRSWQSVAAPYLGLVGLIFCFFPPLGMLLGAGAIALGIWAFARAREGGHGRGRAVVALVTGVAAVALSFFMMLALLSR